MSLLFSFISSKGTTIIPTDYLVVGAGGNGSQFAGSTSGEAGGGGGGGEILTGTLSLSKGTPYTVTVGTAATSQGGNSVFSSVTAYGGTPGRLSGVSDVPVYANTGSGGGGSPTNTGGTTGGIGAGVGNNGGTATATAGGGGGGAGAAGANAASSTGGAGGAGTASSITGSSLLYGAGGGGGGVTGGTGGSSIRTFAPAPWRAGAWGLMNCSG